MEAKRWLNTADRVTELEDVSNAFKDVFHEFGMAAVRADDMEHQDVITQVVLDRIGKSEFLIADPERFNYTGRLRPSPGRMKQSAA